MDKEDEQNESWKEFQCVLLSKKEGIITKWTEGDDSTIELLFKRFDMRNDEKYLKEENGEANAINCIKCDSSELDGLSPLHFALEQKREYPFIFKEIMNYINKDKETQVNASSWVRKNKAKLNVLNADGLPPMCTAIKTDDQDGVRGLLQIGTDIDFQFKWSQDSDKEEISIDFLRYSIICNSESSYSVLSSVGDILGRWDQNGKLGIHFALRYASSSMLKYILKHNQNMDAEYVHNFLKSIPRVRESIDKKNKSKGSGSEISQSEDGISQEDGDDEDIDTNNSNPILEEGSIYSNGSDSEETNLSESMEEEEDNDEINLNDILALQQDMREAGFEISRDSSGNIIARLIPTEDDYGLGLSSMEEKERGSNIFHLLVQNKNADVLEFILHDCRFSEGLNDRRADGLTPFLLATRKNDVQKMKLLTSKAADINYQNVITGCSAAHIACEVGAQEALEYLISIGIDVNARDNSRYTPLHYIAASEKSNNCLGILLEGGARTTDVSMSEESPLYIAISYWNLKAFWRMLDAGADPWKAHSDGTVVLGFIAANSMRQLSRFCDYLYENRRVQNTSNLDIVIGEHGQTALHFAALKVSGRSVLSLLRAGANPNSKDLNGSTPIQYAIESIDKRKDDAKDVVQLLLEHGATLQGLTDEVNELFGLACANGYIDLLEKLFASGVQPTYQEGNKSFLHIACENSREDVVEILINQKFPLEAKDADGCTPLLICAKQHFITGSKLLLEAGADRGTVDSNGDSFIHLCADTFSSRLSEMIEDFQKYGDPVESKNKQGVPPIHYLIQQKQADGLRALIEYGEKKNNLQLQSEDDKTPLMTACEIGFIDGILELIEAGVDVNFRNKKGHTALFFFPDNEHKAVNILNFLFKQNAQLELIDADGDTLLHEATLRGSALIVKFLIMNGSVINIQNKKGETPVFQAAKHGFKEIVKMFLEHNSQDSLTFLRIRDNEGFTPFRIAQKMGHPEIVNLILNSLSIDLSKIAPLKKFSPILLQDGQEKTELTVCAICQDNINIGENVRVLPCFHLFHDECVLQWLGGEEMKNNTTCPICKRHVTPNDI